MVRSTSTSTSTTTSTSSSRSRDRSRSRSHSRSITTATTTFQRAATAVVDVFQRGGHPSPLVIGRPDSSRWQTRSPLAVLLRHKLMHPGIIEQVPRMRMRRTGAAPPAPSSTCSSSSQVSVQLIVDRQRVWLIAMHHNDQRAPSCVSSGSCQGTRPRTQFVGRVPNTQEELPTDVVYRFCQAWPR